MLAASVMMTLRRRANRLRTAFPSRPPPSALRRLGEVAAVCEAPQRLRLDLPHALAREPELLANLLQRRRLAVVADPESELEHAPLALGQVRERPLDRVLPQRHGRLFLGRGILGGEQLAERGLAVAADRLVDARDDATRLADLAHVVETKLRPLGQLLLGGLAAELNEELALGA